MFRYELKEKHKRLLWLVGLLGVAILGVTLILSALQDNIMFFKTPCELQDHPLGNRNIIIRLGGFVVKGSISRKEGNETTFLVNDECDTIKVTYIGLLPDLFKEGQAIVSEGYFTEDKVFKALRVMAKHDENYKPKELKAPPKAPRT